MSTYGAYDHMALEGDEEVTLHLPIHGSPNNQRADVPDDVEDGEVLRIQFRRQPPRGTIFHGLLGVMMPGCSARRGVIWNSLLLA